MQAEALTEFLRSGIALTRALDLRVESCDGGRVRIRAPLTPNLNHHGTAFGGSLAALAVIGGWAAVHVGLVDAGIDADLVVRSSSLDYRRALRSDLIVEATIPAAAWSVFRATLEAGERARISVESSVSEAGQPPALVAQATYVALPSGLQA